MKPNYDVVKRWVNEAQEAVSSDNTMVQVSAGFFMIYLFFSKNDDTLFDFFFQTVSINNIIDVPWCQVKITIM